MKKTLRGIHRPVTTLVLALLVSAWPGFGRLQHPPTREHRARVAGLSNGPLLIGYWHNFVNAAGFVRLANISSLFDVIDIAFGTPVSGSTSTIGFTVDPAESESQFISDVATLHSRGKAVLLSIGGAHAIVQLNTSADVQNFVSSVSSIIDKFGFDGIDIDFEGSSVTLSPGDTDFKNPATPAIVNLVSALRRLKDSFGSGFIVSMAPETFFVQAGFKNYGGQSGAYLPVIFGTRDIITYVHVQDYNSGTMFGLDGKIYAQGTADFHVAMTEMLLQGFPVAGDSNNIFPGLPQGQVAFGVPASASSADGGVTPNTDLVKALNYLIQGTSFGGQYVLRSPAGYPGLRGLMTWSINWDAAAGLSLSSSVGAFLHSLGTGVAGKPVISGATAVGKSLVVTGSGFDNGAIITVNQQDQRTLNDDASPATTLTGIKTIKRARIGRGETVPVQVRNSSGALSNLFQYTRPN